MPYRVTLINNANQTSRITFLLPIPEQSAIFKAAQNKLRLKKPSRIFLPGGDEITSSPSQHIINGTELLISCGEDFIGNRKTLITNSECEVRVIANETFVDPVARNQLDAMGLLPGMQKAVGMPDLHPGTKSPVGAAFVTEGWVYPQLIGGDIGCGMAVYRTFLTVEKVADSEVKKLADWLIGMEGPWPGDVRKWLGEYLLQDEVEEVKEWETSLGTIGAGNHFAELQQITQVLAIDTNDEGCQLHKDQVVLVVHSGSRGLGQSILSKSSESYSSDEEGCAEYLRKHEIACAWAKANRDLIALRFLSSLSRRDLTRQDIVSLKILDIWHNNVEVRQGQYIHRKGAAPATAGSVIIPGSRGTLSAYVRPIPTEETAWSLAHGAGRAQSRAAAFKKLSKKYRMGELERTKLGGWVVCEDKELIYEEAPEGYKDVESVIRDLVDVGACEVIAWGIPRVSYKVRK
jgi:release factor H-coupled RctB family protein